MDFEQFKIFLNADPRSREPEFLEAARSSIQNASDHAKALAFEDKLDNALRVPVVSPTTDDILTHCFGDEQSVSSYRPPTWLAMAAAVLVLVGVASVLLPGASPVDAYAREAFIAHLGHPEPGALSSEDAISADAVILAFANQGIAMRDALADVTYMSPCVIGEKKGMHLVVTEKSGDQITVMMMPGEGLESSHNFSVETMTVQMVPTNAGALALFGHQGQDLSPLGRELVRDINRSNELVAAL
ncbi:MAG: DUF3379 family protein [Lysobacterales bacterium]